MERDNGVYSDVPIGWRLHLIRTGKVVALFAITVALYVGLMWLFFSHGGPAERPLHNAGASQATILDLLNATGLALLLAITMALRRKPLSGALRELGITPVAKRAFVATLFAFAVSVAILYAIGYRAHFKSLAVLWAFDIFGPFIEEVLFRGFLFLQFRRWIGLPFWLAALLASVPFALEHTYEGTSSFLLIEVMAVTLAGGVLFCWLVERWGSLWAAWVLHAGLNITFAIFPFGTTAAGNLVGNLHRLLVVVLVVAATVVLTQRNQSAKLARPRI